MTETVDLTEKTLGEFRVLRKIGGGGMADVYLAIQSSLERHVALKVMRPSLMSGSDDVLKKRFRQEAMMAAGLNHPNIVQVYTIGEEDGFHFIAQEFVQGKNLAQLLKAKGKADVGSSLHIMRQVASALKAAGAAGIVHRDIKPENIMLTKRGEVKITDFGLAQLNEKKGDGSLTEQGMTLGTPLYMSPEQVRGMELDPRSDIYSFGVTAYHMLSGAPPYRGSSPMSIAIQHVNNTPEPLRGRAPEVPEPLARMIHRMMEQDRERRYPSATELYDDIRKLVSAQKAKQDLNVVRLPHLDALEQQDAAASGNGKSRDLVQAPPAKKKKKSRRSGSTSSRMRIPAASRPAKTQIDAAPQQPPASSADDDDDDDLQLGREKQELEDMDLTPMVDVTFLLLIFFMITASFTLQKSLNVPPPDPDEGMSESPVTEDMQSESIEVRIDQTNTILVEGVAVDGFQDLVSLLEQKMGETGKTALLLEAEPESTHGKSIMVFDAAQEAKIQKIRQKLPSD